MALQGSIQIEGGTTCANAYVRLTIQQCVKSDGTWRALWAEEIHPDNSTKEYGAVKRLDGTANIGEFDYNPSGGDIMAQAYADAKLSGKYTDFSDV